MSIHPAWVAPCVLAILWCLLQWAGGPATWGYERAAIDDGQVWRLLTGNLVHINATHLALNLLGLAGVTAVWGRELGSWRVLAAVFSGSALAVGLGLWFTTPELAWYSGASGALHGLFAAGLVLATGTGRLFRLVAALGLLAKLAIETRLDTGTAELIGAPVIHAAHQWGAAGGLVIALILRLMTCHSRDKGRD